MRTITLIATLMILAAVAANAAVPPMMSYQGKLLQPSGAPVPDGTYSMQFAIYDAPTGGTLKWTEPNPSVQVKGGLFAVLLGSITPLPSNIFDNPSRFFGVKVGADPEMTPRQQVASSAFAFRAAVAGTVDDGAITTGKLAPDAVTDAKVADAANILSSKLDFSPSVMYRGAPCSRPKIATGVFDVATTGGQRMYYTLSLGTTFTEKPMIIACPGAGSNGSDNCTVTVQNPHTDSVELFVFDSVSNPHRSIYWIAIGY